MNELSYKNKIQIESLLYKKVMLIIESLYDLECNIDKDKKDSTKIIFRDKKAAIQRVAQSIEEFAQENNIDKNEVKDYLINIIKKREKSKSIFKEEYDEAKGIISKDDDKEER